MTHWSSRLLADRLGIGNASVARAWRAYGIKPWKAESFRFPPTLSWSRRSPGLIERRSQDYVRHGTSTLFAALDIATVRSPPR